MRKLTLERKLILFGSKYPNLDIFAQNFGRRMSDLKSVPSKYSTCGNVVKIRNLLGFDPKTPNLGNWAQNFRKQISTIEIGYRQSFVKRLES